MRDYTFSFSAAASGTLAPAFSPGVLSLLVAVLITTSGQRVERGADTFHKTTVEIRPWGGPADGQERNGTWRGSGRRVQPAACGSTRVCPAVHGLLSRESMWAGNVGGQDRKVEGVGSCPTHLHPSGLLCVCLCVSVCLCLFHTRTSLFH